VLEGQGIKFGADWWGKWKMILQSIAIPVALITPAVTRVLPPAHANAQYHWVEAAWGRQLIDVTVWSMMFFTVFSGLPYIIRCVRLLAEARAARKPRAEEAQAPPAARPSPVITTVTKAVRGAGA
jgi:phosphatidylglycerophosphate synthase